MKELLAFGLCLITQILFAQTFTKRDSLQGGLPFERICFDVLHYGLDITVNPEERSIKGVNHIGFKVLENTKRIQLDLFENMKVERIVLNKGRYPFHVMEGDNQTSEVDFMREYDAVFLNFSEILQKGEEYQIAFYYSGKPQEAKNAPWDGG